MIREAGALLFLVATATAAVTLAFAMETAEADGAAFEPLGPREALAASAARGSVPPLPAPDASLPAPDPAASGPPAPGAAVSAQATPLPPGQEPGSHFPVAALVNGTLAGAAIAALALSQMNRREPLP